MLTLHNEKKLAEIQKYERQRPLQNLCKPTSPGVERELQNGAHQTSTSSIDERGQSEKGAINTYKILDLEPSPLVCGNRNKTR